MLMHPLRSDHCKKMHGTSRFVEFCLKTAFCKISAKLLTNSRIYCKLKGYENIGLQQILLQNPFVNTDSKRRFFHEFI